MILCHKSSGAMVEPGEVLTSFRGELFTLKHVVAPVRSGSTGRVVVVAVGDPDAPENTSEFYPGVFGLEWRAA